MGGTNAMIADKDFNRPQPLQGFRDGPLTTFKRSEVGRHVFHTGLFQLTFTARNGHYTRTTACQQFSGFTPDSATRTSDQRYPSLNSCHEPALVIKEGIIKNFANVELVDKYQVTAAMHALLCKPKHPILELSYSLGTVEI
jgi:hypothetical protein